MPEATCDVYLCVKMTSKGLVYLRPFRERKVKQSYDMKEGYGQV